MPQSIYDFDLLFRESGSDWADDLEMALKVKLAKYGVVDQLSIEKESNCVWFYSLIAQGDIYIRMDRLSCATDVQKSFDGRFFANRQVCLFPI
jgi:hypothetical protein